MDLQQILQIGAAAFRSGTDSRTAQQLPTQNIIGALMQLLGDGKGGIDIGSLVQMASKSGLLEIAQSWLGDGKNAGLSMDGVIEMLGKAKISQFASQLGIDEKAAVGGLQEAIPTMVDKASSGGSLLDSLGGAEGMLGMASKFFGR